MSDGGKQFFPRADAPLVAWAGNFWLTADGLVPGVPIPQDQVDAVEAALAEWQVALGALEEAHAAYEAAVRAKAGRRDTLERAIRALARTVQAMPQITDADRAKFGIPVRKRGGRPLRAKPEAALAVNLPALAVGRASIPPSTFPLVEIKHIGVRTHTLHIADSATPLRRALPRGAKWAEVWLRLDAGQGDRARDQMEGTEPHGTLSHGHMEASAPPGSDVALCPCAIWPCGSVGGPSGGFRFLRIATRAAVRTTFDAADVGKQARYMLRWMGKGHAPGPWSAVASATVAA